MSKLISILAFFVIVVALVLGASLLSNGLAEEKFSRLLNANAQTQAQFAGNDSDNSNDSTITVNADYTASAIPTKAEIQLAIETTDFSAQQSQQKNAVLAQKVMDALKKAGIPANSIKTISYSLHEKTRWEPRTQETVNEGYETINSIQVTVSDISQTGKIIDAAVDAGANRVSGITFTIEDIALKALKRDALKAAGQEAQAKASAIASGLNVQLDKVLSANENGFVYQPYKYAMDASAIGGGATVPTPLTPGDVQITASLTVTYKIK